MILPDKGHRLRLDEVGEEDMVRTEARIPTLSLNIL